MRRLTTLAVLGLLTVLAASWLYECFGDAETAAQIKGLASADIPAEVDAALAAGELRFAEIGSQSATPPGSFAYIAPFMGYGPRYVAGHSCQPEGPQHHRLLRTAYRYKAQYNGELRSRLLEIEQQRLDELEPELAADPEHYRSFDEAWTFVVLRRMIYLELQNLEIGVSQGSEWTQTAELNWKLYLLHQRRRAVEAELRMRATGIDRTARRTLLNQITDPIEHAIQQQERWLYTIRRSARAR